MQLAIFGIENDGLNLVVNLFVMMLVVVWLALIVWTYLDARRRIVDPVLVLCATAASLFPYIGTFVYSILRPPEFLEDARERELEIKAAELRVRQLSELSCPNCGFPVEKSYLRCPNCQRRLKDPCQSCGKPVDPRWALCPYCETALPGRQQARRAPPEPPKRREAPQRQQPRKAPARAGSRRTEQETSRPEGAKGPKRAASRKAASRSSSSSKDSARSDKTPGKTEAADTAVEAAEQSAGKSE